MDPSNFTEPRKIILSVFGKNVPIIKYVLPANGNYPFLGKTEEEKHGIHGRMGIHNAPRARKERVDQTMQRRDNSRGGGLLNAQKRLNTGSMHQ